MLFRTPKHHLICIANRSAISERAAQGNLSQFNSLDLELPWFGTRRSVATSTRLTLIRSAWHEPRTTRLYSVLRSSKTWQGCGMNPDFAAKTDIIDIQSLD
jgi:hypothetical protein